MTMQTQILIVEDDVEWIHHISKTIRDGIPAAKIHIARSWEEMHYLLETNNFDVVVSGFYYFGDIEGRAYNTILNEVREASRGIPVIFLSYFAKLQHVFEAAKLGAFNFILLDRRNFEKEELISSVKSAVELGRIPRVFISYSSHDRAFAEKLATSIHKCGFQVWYDEWEIHVGDSIIRKIESGIIASSYLVVVLSQASVSSRWVLEELDTAMTSQITDRKISVLPALKEDCAIPPFLRSKKYADFRDDFAVGLDKIVNRIKADRRSAT